MAHRHTFNGQDVLIPDSPPRGRRISTAISASLCSLFHAFIECPVWVGKRGHVMANLYFKPLFGRAKLNPQFIVR